LSESKERYGMAARQPDDLLAGITHPMFRLESPKLTKKEKVLKREVDSYVTSDVRDTARILIGQRAHEIRNSVDLPDAICSGLTFKMRVVHLKKGSCYLLARWKPDRYMRRNTGGLSQKWFIEKEIFPSNTSRFMQRIQEQKEEQQA